MIATDSIAGFNFDELELDNEFWQFSLSVWKNSSMQACLLDCQNQKGLRVNQLLLALWASSEDLSLHNFFRSQPSVLEVWHSSVLEPLRNIRKQIPKQKTLVEIRQGIQQKEIEAEQIEQAMMYHSVKNNCETRQSIDLLDTLLNNLVLSGVRDSALLLLLAKLFVDLCDKTLPSEREIIDCSARLINNMD